MSSSGSDGSASSASSYTSGDFGDVARGGFTRMYVLSHSALYPVDKSNDYRSEFVVDDSGNANARREEARTHRDIRDEHGEPALPQYQLLYASGSHYFHGAIELPERLGLERAAASSRHSIGGGDSDGDDILTRVRCPHDISVADLAVLLPHFQEQQDVLVEVDKLTDFRSEIRDVLYQMEEVGAFMVEELSKDKTIERIEQASKELRWVVSPTNPTFFELQTNASTNADLDDAGVVLVVMKIVVRGVLLDVVYARSSYFVVLRDNCDELALEDTFIPNVARAGPCFVVRRYKDEDITKLVLWCALPTPDAASNFAVEGKRMTPVDLPIHLNLSLANCGTSAKVAPLAVRGEREILQANDTQLYCLLQHVPRAIEKPARARAKQRRKRSQRKLGDDDSDRSDDSDDEREQRDLVVFQFNQYVYSGELWLRPALLDNLAKLSTHVLPHLRAQSHLLEFFGETEDLPPAAASASSDCAGMSQFVSVRHRFNDLAPTLLTLLTESQAWIQAFLSEVDAIAAAEDCTSSSTSSSEWLASHLKAWLEADDGLEAFFELELAAGSPFCRASRDDEPVDLVVWKGIVNAAVMVVVYRSCSFFMTLREQLSDSDSIGAQDDRQLFGAIPPLGSKGRGYLVRKFPDTALQPSQAWLAGAKLLLWQTSASLAQEEIREALARDERCKSGKSNEAPCADWFVDESAPTAAEAKAGGSRARHSEVRSALHTAAKGPKDSDSDSKELNVKALVPPSADKVGRRHHIPPLSSPAPHAKSGAAAPWDLRTGRPL